MISLPLKLKPKPWLVGTVLAAVAMTGGVVFMGLTQGGWTIARRDPEPNPTSKRLPQVAALGRLEPQGEIIQVAAPLALDGDRLAELKVKVGDRVQAGEPIAILDSRDRLQDEVVAARLTVQKAEANLAQVKAGAKPGAIATQEANVTRQSADLAGQIRIQTEAIARLEAEYEGDRQAQSATISRLDAELKTAQAELTRYEALFEDGAVSASIFDNKKLAVATTQEALEEAQAILSRTRNTSQRQIQAAQAELTRLQSAGQAQVQAARSTLDEVAQVRPVDINMAEVELKAAQANLIKAQNDLSKAIITAPQSGQILEIYTRPGEQMSSEGIVAIGKTNQMLAIAEIYQSDINRVKLGQSARVSGQAFEGALQGKVVEIGRQISRQSVFSGEPGENLDRRIVEVKIALTPADSQRVQNLSNLQVQTLITVEDASTLAF